VTFTHLEKSIFSKIDFTIICLSSDTFV